jgi:hypothetical protein
VRCQRSLYRSALKRQNWLHHDSANKSHITTLLHCAVAYVVTNTLDSAGSACFLLRAEVDNQMHDSAGINFILSSMVFNVVPTALEVSLVAGILAWKCGPALAGLTAGTLVAYTAFTFAVTQVFKAL